MTYRERRLAKAERLRGWSEKRTDKGRAKLRHADSIASFIPFGQPILVGHHSEKRHRRDLARINAKTDAGFADLDKARSMASRADNIERAADNAIYDDDADAVERLEAKIAGLEAQRETIKRYNATCRKIKGDYGDLSILSDPQKQELLQCLRFQAYACKHGAFPAYVGANLSGNISRLRKRVDGLKRQAQIIAERPEREAGGATIAPAANGWAGYVDVTFPSKPGRDVLDEIKAAGFRWVGNLQCWRGAETNLPECYAA